MKVFLINDNRIIKYTGEKWPAKTNGKPNVEDNFALNMLEPNIHIRISNPTPGVTFTSYEDKKGKNIWSILFNLFKKFFWNS